ncbi:Hpt domain-containing protein [Arthrobacter sp. Soil762]|uniref:Hpt domain-containing protein n=1 Tax=Arthrobacter sp. Soil762 TaxID=1736401 RepID=UPI001F3E98F5|nr:Hpt domain-containing protein [Arthrobacter sp. Soil762]
MVISAAAPFGAAGGTNPAGALDPSAPTGTASPFPGNEELPLVDRTVLQTLEEQLGRPDMARNFAKDYSALWGQRERRLVDSLEREDQAVALDAAISLKVSSAMVGGLRLACLAQMLEAAVRHGDLRHAASVLALISIHGPATVNELQHQYLR